MDNLEQLFDLLKLELVQVILKLKLHHLDNKLDNYKKLI